MPPFSHVRNNLRNRGITIYESDIHPVERYLMERMVTGGFEAEGCWTEAGSLLSCRNPLIRGALMTPDLKVLSLDIETNAEQGTILSIRMLRKPTNRIYAGEWA